MTQHQIVRADPATVFRQEVEQMAGHFLGQVVSPERAQESIARVAIAFRMAALKNPDLYAVPQESLARAVALCALTGLMPAGPAPDVELIPRRSEGALQLDWQVTSRGWVTLARQSGWDIEAVPVFTGETFRAPRGLASTIEHEPNYSAEQTWDTLILFYVLATKPAHATRWRVVPKSKLEQLRKKAQTDKIWREWPLEMAEKAAKGWALRRGLVPLGGDASAAEDPESAMGQFLAAKRDEAKAIAQDIEPQVTRLLEVTTPKKGPDAVRAALTETPETTTGARAKIDADTALSKQMRDQSERDADRMAIRLADTTRITTIAFQEALELEVGHEVSDTRAAAAMFAGITRGLWTLSDGWLTLPGPRVDPEQAERTALIAELSTLGAHLDPETTRNLREIHKLAKISPTSADLGKLRNLVGAAKEEVAGRHRQMDADDRTADYHDDDLRGAVEDLLQSLSAEDVAAAHEASGVPTADGAPVPALRRLLAALGERIPGGGE